MPARLTTSLTAVAQTPALVREFSHVTDERPLRERTPFPGSIPERLRAQRTFLIEVEKLKTVLRQSPLTAADRRENDAEHSWHLAMMLVLAEYSDEPVDVAHTIQLVVVHDLIEIYAGDTPLDDTEAHLGQDERERAAADHLFPLLPADQSAHFRALWDEFEQRRSPEARFAKTMDRLQPFLLNWMTRDRTWQAAGASADDVRKRNESVIGEASASLWEATEKMIDEAQRQGWLQPGT